MPDNLQAYAEKVIKDHNIPAVSIAVWEGGKLSGAAAGILNLNTGVKATTDSIFQIGSITKVMTTSLVMQLVDEGLVDLDKPVKHYLRDFMIADAEASEVITVRQLLTHTSGIAGDYFPNDHGHEGNLIARYVDRCSFLPLAHPVGEGFSYSNAAFSVAGRLVEVMRRTTWAQAIKTYLYEPLGMSHAIADPGDGFLFRSAMGHVTTGAEKGSVSDLWKVPKDVYLTLGQAPAGTTPAMTASDLITFARAHMAGGVSDKGERWLSEDAVAMMQTSHWEHKNISQLCRKHQGLGWMISEYHGGGRMVAHNGATNGFLSSLVMFPEKNMAFALLLNSFSAVASQKVSGELLQAVAGIDMEEPEPAGETDTAFLAKFIGQFSCLDSDIEVFLEDGKLFATIVYKIDPVPPFTIELRHVEEGCFATYRDSGERSPNVLFLNSDKQGVPHGLFNGLRLNNRVYTKEY